MIWPLTSMKKIKITDTHKYLRIHFDKNSSSSPILNIYNKNAIYNQLLHIIANTEWGSW